MRLLSVAAPSEWSQTFAAEDKYAKYVLLWLKCGYVSEVARGTPPLFAAHRS